MGLRLRSRESRKPTALGHAPKLFELQRNGQADHLLHALRDYFGQ